MIAALELPHKTPPRILVVGIWGTGKTTVGRLLSQQLGWPFIDSDELIDGFIEAVRTNDQRRLSERTCRLRSLVVSDDGSPAVIATNLRPLLTSDCQLDGDVRWAIESGRCLVIEVQREIDEIATFLAENAPEREKRPSLSGDSSKQIAIDLAEQGRLLAPIYEEHRSGSVTLRGWNVEEAVAEILGLLAERGIAPLDR